MSTGISNPPSLAADSRWLTSELRRHQRDSTRWEPNVPQAPPLGGRNVGRGPGQISETRAPHCSGRITRPIRQPAPEVNMNDNRDPDWPLRQDEMHWDRIPLRQPVDAGIHWNGWHNHGDDHGHIRAKERRPCGDPSREDQEGGLGLRSAGVDGCRRSGSLRWSHTGGLTPGWRAKTRRGTPSRWAGDTPWGPRRGKTTQGQIGHPP